MMRPRSLSPRMDPSSAWTLRQGLGDHSVHSITSLLISLLISTCWLSTPSALIDCPLFIHLCSVSFLALDSGEVWRLTIAQFLLAHYRSRLDTKGPQDSAKGTSNSSGPDWVKRAPRQAGHRALLAAAVSDDGRYLAVGGGDWRVHVWDARSNEYIQVRSYKMQQQ